jgi:hypothetical protein
MKLRFFGLILFILFCLWILIFSFTHPPVNKAPEVAPTSYTSTDLWFNTAGPIVMKGPLRHFVDSIVNPASATGITFNISSAGFTKLLGVVIEVRNNTNVITNVPLTEWTTSGTTSITCNILTSNSQLISLLGVNVVGLQFPGTVPTGTTVYCYVWGM